MAEHSSVLRRLFKVLVCTPLLLIYPGGCGGGTEGTNTSSTTVTGIVATRAGTGVPGARLTSESGQETVTERNGFFTFDVPDLEFLLDGTVDLFVEVPDFMGMEGFSSGVTISDISTRPGEIRVGLTADFASKTIEISATEIIEETPAVPADDQDSKSPKRTPTKSIDDESNGTGGDNGGDAEESEPSPTPTLLAPAETPAPIDPGNIQTPSVNDTPQPTPTLAEESSGGENSTSTPTPTPTPRGRPSCQTSPCETLD